MQYSTAHFDVLYNWVASTMYPLINARKGNLESVEWNGAMEHWNGLVEWNNKMVLSIMECKSSSSWVQIPQLV